LVENENGKKWESFPQVKKIIKTHANKTVRGVGVGFFLEKDIPRINTARRHRRFHFDRKMATRKCIFGFFFSFYVFRVFGGMGLVFPPLKIKRKFSTHTKREWNKNGKPNNLYLLFFIARLTFLWFIFLIKDFYSCMQFLENYWGWRVSLDALDWENLLGGCTPNKYKKKMLWYVNIAFISFQERILHFSEWTFQWAFWKFKEMVRTNVSWGEGESLFCLVACNSWKLMWLHFYEVF
jgi:hypothetical protein